MATAELDISGYRHEKGWLHAWTGDWVHFTGADLFSTGPSLDQIVAGAIARPDQLPSLELQVEEGRPICHAGHSQQLPLEGDPRAAFDRVFGLLNSTDPLLQAQGSILDFAIEEYKGLRGYLRPADRARLAAHFDLVRQLEQRLVGLSEATCDTGSLLGLAGTSEGYDALFQSMADLVAAAFSCDLTRVATLSLGDLPSDDFGWGWYLSGDAHNDFAHRIFQDDESAQAMSDYTAAHAAQLAYLIGLLESIPDPEGGSLMDHTLIAWGSELGDGWHGYDRWCALTAGRLAPRHRHLPALGVRRDAHRPAHRAGTDRALRPAPPAHARGHRPGHGRRRRPRRPRPRPVQGRRHHRPHRRPAGDGLTMGVSVGNPGASS